VQRKKTQSPCRSGSRQSSTGTGQRRGSVSEDVMRGWMSKTRVDGPEVGRQWSSSRSRELAKQRGQERLDGMGRVAGTTAAIDLISFPPVSQLANCRVRRVSAESIGARFPLHAHLPLVFPCDFTYARNYLSFFLQRASLRTLLPTPAAAFSLLRRLSDALATPYTGRSRRARRLDWKIAQMPRRRLNNFDPISSFPKCFWS